MDRSWTVVWLCCAQYLKMRSCFLPQSRGGEQKLPQDSRSERNPLRPERWRLGTQERRAWEKPTMFSGELRILCSKAKSKKKGEAVVCPAYLVPLRPCDAHQRRWQTSGASAGWNMDEQEKQIDTRMHFVMYCNIVINKEQVELLLSICVSVCIRSQISENCRRCLNILIL